MKKYSAFTTLLLAALVLSACSLVSTPTPAATISMQPIPPTATVSVPTMLPLGTAVPTLEPTIAPSPTPYQPFEAVIMVDNLMLRSGPGFLLPSLGMYAEKGVVEVLGRAPGASWLYVRAADGKQGWMKLELLELKGDFYDAPEVEPSDFIIIRGHMYTPNGSPASHITLTLMPKDGTTADADAATTDILGRFYFFLPEDSRGTWILEANAYGCESTAVNNACSLIGSFPPAQEITFTESPEVWYNLQILP